METPPWLVDGNVVLPHQLNAASSNQIQRQAHLRPIRYWPGGIPACVQYHPTKQLTEEERSNGVWDFPGYEETVDESKGWLLFVTVCIRLVPSEKQIKEKEGRVLQLCSFISDLNPGTMGIS
jgi:hypothetical protein